MLSCSSFIYYILPSCLKIYCFDVYNCLGYNRLRLLYVLFSDPLPYTLRDRKLGAQMSYCEQEKCFHLLSEHLGPDSFPDNFIFVLPCYEFLARALKGTDLQSQRNQYFPVKSQTVT